MEFPEFWIEKGTKKSNSKIREREGNEEKTFPNSPNRNLLQKKSSFCGIISTIIEKENMPRHLSQHSQLQLVTPIMMRITARRKNTRPERL